MSKLPLFLTAVLALGLLSGCFPTIGGAQVVGSGRSTTQEYDFKDFTRVNIGSAFEATVTQGESYRVAVTVDDNLVQYLDVRVTGDTLRIGLKPLAALSLRNMTLRAEVTLPDVEGLDFSGATRATVNGFKNDKRVDVTVSGASQLSGDLSSGELRVDASGASRVELTGSTGPLQATASGASTLRLAGVTATDARVDASGASNITVNASGRLTGGASGASSIRYTGSPSSVQVDTSGASSVRQD